MKKDFMPKTRLGKWSVRFGASFAALYLVSVIIVGLSQKQIGEEFIMNPIARPFLIVAGLLAMASGVLAFFTGIISFVKYKERSVFVYVTIFLGFLAVAFIIGEFLFPH